ncbi:hypothetical protein [Flavobacterium sp. NKUCC04_CG]|uniref:hypothetical protein n=1 Tax=Flavobacterium sp. NKUCC04_CG TaxID=2842121 RepID=UPI001C5B0553|nr:hypothetical protein [Flavobacterium sp. NKUCC04_CG]MBW3520297.1 hypothetical protein [Flavobacterium sp. NKUCC04_CG]
MTKTKITLALLGLFLSLTAIAGEPITEKKSETFTKQIVVLGSGGLKDMGPWSTVCPNTDRVHCAMLTRAFTRDTRLQVGEVVKVNILDDTTNHILKVIALSGSFDREGNILGKDILFEKVN